MRSALGGSVSTASKALQPGDEPGKEERVSLFAEPDCKLVDKLNRDWFYRITNRVLPDKISHELDDQIREQKRRVLGPSFGHEIDLLAWAEQTGTTKMRAVCHSTEGWTNQLNLVKSPSNSTELDSYFRIRICGKIKGELKNGVIELDREWLS
jgi:hypothetical protein